MKGFIDAGRDAVRNNNLYSALALALVLPDICGQLETPWEKSVGKRYKRWFQEWAESKFTRTVGHDSTPTVFLSAQDCYLLRCSLLHAGTDDLDAASATVQKFIFCDPAIGNVHMNSINMNSKTYLQLRADLFCNDLFDAAEAWDTAKQSDQDVQSRKLKLLSIKSAGDNVDGLIHFG